MNGKFVSKYIDLHAHLDGSITVEILKKLAEIQQLELPVATDAELEKLITVSENCQSLNEFLQCFELPGKYMQTEIGIREAVKLVLANMAAGGVVYAEIRFAPQLHTFRGLTQEEVIQAALAGLKEASIPANLILCCMRGDDNAAQNKETVELAKKYLVADGGVVAVDLAGAEALFPNEGFRELLQAAHEAGIPLTIHSGEAGGPENVESAIEMGALRVGHGVRIAGNDRIMQLVKEKGITLEMAPTSNRQTKTVVDMKAEYPLKQFLQYGLKVTINTDDMAVEGTTLADEFRYIEREFGITPEEEKRMLGNAVAAAFTSEARKEELRKVLAL
ncbi:adenosine deaminase [Selenomonas sp. WCT3]|uniref:adenosine deaminase n=1 Tax=Selenomonas sp. WCT3 TaxID=3158785 RepID=UPI0008919D3A|nr:adenosine deaminase [Selenomonas ruminantium]